MVGVRRIHEQSGNVTKHSSRAATHRQQPQFFDYAAASESGYQKDDARCNTEQGVQLCKRSIWSAIHDSLPSSSAEGVAAMFFGSLVWIDAILIVIRRAILTP